MDGKNVFGERLKELRAGKGLSQQALADAADLHRVEIAKLEAGSRSPAWETVQKLVAALGVDCTAFNDQAGKSEPAPEAKPAAKKRKKGGA